MTVVAVTEFAGQHALANLAFCWWRSRRNAAASSSKQIQFASASAVRQNISKLLKIAIFQYENFTKLLHFHILHPFGLS